MAQIPSVAGGVPLVATKLFAPRPRPDLVPRPRLLARLDAGLDAGRCSLLSAPAGAGKTSLLAAGRSNAEMAAELFVEQSTVKTHLIHLYRKLGAHSRTQTVARARALGLLD